MGVERVPALLIAQQKEGGTGQLIIAEQIGFCEEGPVVPTINFRLR